MMMKKAKYIIISLIFAIVFAGIAPRAFSAASDVLSEKSKSESTTEDTSTSSSSGNENSNEKKKKYSYAQYNSNSTNKRIKACEVSRFKDKYQQSCFSCNTVVTMIGTFLEACSIGYDTVRRAGNIILLILSMLWIGLFVFQNLSKFSSIDIAQFMSTFGTFVFKFLIAWACINGGINLLLSYTLYPIISFATDFGLSLLSLTANDVVTPFDMLMEVKYA